MTSKKFLIYFWLIISLISPIPQRALAQGEQITRYPSVTDPLTGQPSFLSSSIRTINNDNVDRENPVNIVIDIATICFTLLVFSAIYHEIEKRIRIIRSKYSDLGPKHLGPKGIFQKTID